jgi:hypothetical protein
MRLLWTPWIAVGVIAASAGAPTPTPTPPPESADDLYQVGQQLFDQYAPA